MSSCSAPLRRCRTVDRGTDKLDGRGGDNPQRGHGLACHRFDVDFWATANRFEAGHRIRLDISSSNFPSFDVNPNTGEPIGRHTHMIVALNSVFHDADHQSHLLLPVHPV